MRLVAEHEENRVVVLEDVEQFLEIGTRMVRVENVPRILAALRTSARALLPVTPTDPARMEHLAARIQGLAQLASALVAKVPADDPHAMAMKAELVELGLAPPSPPPPDPPPGEPAP
ncbi:MAG TPA: hypothetical protein VNI55_06575 [Gaiellaceae bacterium]|nr:hypothetical protein [Gaiellaceae bacterium]